MPVPGAGFGGFFHGDGGGGASADEISQGAVLVNAQQFPDGSSLILSDSIVQGAVLVNAQSFGASSIENAKGGTLDTSRDLVTQSSGGTQTFESDTHGAGTNQSLESDSETDGFSRYWRSRTDTMATMLGAEDQQVSIALWHKAVGGQDSGDTIVGWGNLSTACVGLTWNTDDQIQAICGNRATSTNTLLETLTTGEADNWHFYVLTVDLNNNRMRLYVDGTEEQSRTDNALAALPDLTDRIELNRLFSTTQGKDHFYDEVGIWDRELTGAEVNTIYNSGSHFDLIDGASAPSGLIGYWRIGSDQPGDTTSTLQAVVP